MAPSVQDILDKAAPVLGPALDALDKAGPYLHTGYDKSLELWEQAQAFHIKELFPAFIGLFMCFFGGKYMVIIATVEAFRSCGWEKTQKYLVLLWNDLQEVAEANTEDNKVDADGDGIPDVKQIPVTDLAKRKSLLFLRTCNPDHLSEAFQGLNSGFIAVLAVLKVKFAKTITLGASIAEILLSFSKKTIEKQIQGIVPDEYDKWVSPGLMYVSKAIGITIAFWLERVVSAFHASLRGGQLFAHGSIHYAAKYGALAKYLDKDGDGKPDLSTDSPVYVGLGLGIGVLGFLTQISLGFSLPFPFNLFFLPLTISEWVLQWIINE